MITLQPTFRLRMGPSLLHGFVAWAFIYYLLVNFVDILEGLFSGFNLFDSWGRWAECWRCWPTCSAWQPW